MFNTHCQDKKELNITRAEKAPKIDGELNDKVWENAEIATDFIQFKPEIGNTLPRNKRTEVKVSYDDQAIYVAAYLYDNPEKIMSQIVNRDNFGQTDFFLVVLNPNNDAQNDTSFFVFSSGQQADAISNPTIGEDFSWNAVWSSAVKMKDDGWTVEMKIPYRTLRFADQENPTWGLQFHRQFRRDRSQYTWNPIDPTKGYIGLYNGELKGLDNLKPPLRLNLYPFSTGILNSFDGDIDTDLTFGMDVKYGITDNFTLDATLIPDFSQAGFDNIVLNLGPFEQTFSEQRQFFTEGVDLFSKGGLFFSRRVGGRPSGELDLAENEDADVPNEVKVLNALKVSGRTKDGWGLGLFNAITEKTYATVTDNDTGDKRLEVVEPFTNYNILVVDKQFGGNSAISLINTNVTREGEFRDANATALVANLVNKKNTYRVDTELRMSNVNYQNDPSETGFSSFLFVGKVAGNFRYSFDHKFADTKYNINDLGLNRRNNQNDFGFDFSYQTFEPSGRLNNYRFNFFSNYRRLVDPNTFARFNFGGGYRAFTKNQNAHGFRLNIQPGKQYDYFESRDGRPFIFENSVSAGAWFSSNYNKVFAIDLRANAATLFEEGRDLFRYDFEIEPRIRFSDQLLLTYGLNFENRNGDRGYATSVDDNSIFGERNRQIVTNTISGNYTFNPFHSLGLTFRHYWDTVQYDYDLFTLLDNGRLTAEEGYNIDNVVDDPNINFSTWNIDLSYSWQFAPGSFLTALYRNQLFNFDENSEDNFTESLDLLFQQPMQNTFSLRVQYFIDFNGLKSVFKKNKTAS
ncbi:carbohydrate binding family 9 domain-containing protein [Winogradskyella sp. KYW1333]|uniref:carbohydrate binding family 9 domain-containing protein n=1 Tax=Winogradskyella sp. KYW1333 TaxID=2282123 RepID=UPI0021626F23|nr:carbohydrate binding family 9 domain-containing protein [Winogradskyella sp. KYW1333]